MEPLQYSRPDNTILRNYYQFSIKSYVYILRLVLWDQQKYSEKSENIKGLDSYILNSFSYLSPI